MIMFNAKGCTRALDEAIRAARLQYAEPRDYFYKVFPNLTSLDVRHVLHGERSSELRRDFVRRLFAAQRQDPHDLWTLLLVQAFEAELVERRRSITLSVDKPLDQLVLDTFVHALAHIPESLPVGAIEAHVLRTAGVDLRKALRREHGSTRVTMERAARDASRARRAFRHTPVRLLVSGE